ncbi:hypothetical protein L1987_53034 [Smallanthus sonchifolius]|uniref:Uncharacterized protein n=1 Tax=Smallanthus sonchifolius TaxID=185202 RepID=A0ACB9EVZ4_9ASTR|nr:hypothetical protein L1987_53034 [Smallanthus sonchifolius]
MVEKPICDPTDESNEETKENVTSLPITVQVPDVSSHGINKDHQVDTIIGSLTDGVRTRSTAGDINRCLYSYFISQIEPKNIKMALLEPSFESVIDTCSATGELNKFT